MPTYEYLCEGCDHRFEELQSFSEEPLTKCPQCKKKKLKRLFGTGAAVLFKGSGFYETDYRSESYKAAEKKDSEASSSSSSSSSGTSSSGTTGTTGSNSAGTSQKSDGGNNGSKSTG